MKILWGTFDYEYWTKPNNTFGLGYNSLRNSHWPGNYVYGGNRESGRGSSYCLPGWEKMLQDPLVVNNVCI